MNSSRRRRVMGLGALAVIAGLALAYVAACSSTDSPGAIAGSEGGGGGDGGSDATKEDDSTAPDPDAAEDAGVDAPHDASTRDANGPGAVDAVCSFNRDCQSALRCECDEATGCACKAGVRGTGKNGIDPCTTGNTCVSAVCVEGPPDAGSFCSDECVTSADCTGKLPLCQTIAFVGRICIRTPPP